MLRDETLLLDMLLAARDAIGFVAAIDEAQFEDSKLHQNAVIRSIEIIGEAAGKVSRAFQQVHPEFPGMAIIGMRHRLIHDYNEVRLDLVWDVARNRLPELITALQVLVPPPDDEG
ncbi:MAG TPA: DUF86 domain-containing protein [Acetobacteraceae bacterium]|nr:DUF86 domain-containing protein [Acetobacteraceae bacterium]